ncbi:MAG TPA: N-glycosylase/DNA lyase [Spirochaetota bacterium]|nr:N-glycosylase/DNA lyase [Spirochaetota bacterium]
MKHRNDRGSELRSIYDSIRVEVSRQLEHFSRRWEFATDRELFIQLVFCLLTPQSKARQCLRAVQILLEDDLLFHGRPADIAARIPIVRFRNKKAEYIVRARETLYGPDRPSLRSILDQHAAAFDMRSWLASAVTGYGYKEASHFLRNIGHGGSLAILDRHILKNLTAFGVIDGPPSNLSAARYLTYENAMRDFSQSINIPLDYLDFVLWYKETGDIFQ